MEAGIPSITDDDMLQGDLQWKIRESLYGPLGEGGGLLRWCTTSMVPPGESEVGRRESSISAGDARG